MELTKRCTNTGNDRPAAMCTNTLLASKRRFRSIAVRYCRTHSVVPSHQSTFALRTSTESLGAKPSSVSQPAQVQRHENGGPLNCQGSHTPHHPSRIHHGSDAGCTSPGGSGSYRKLNSCFPTIARRIWASRHQTERGPAYLIIRYQARSATNTLWSVLLHDWLGTATYYTFHRAVPSILPHRQTQVKCRCSPRFAAA